jgi:hypothetical protein
VVIELEIKDYLSCFPAGLGHEGATGQHLSASVFFLCGAVTGD